MLRFVIVNSVTLAYIAPSCAIPQLHQRVLRIRGTCKPAYTEYAGRMRYPQGILNYLPV